MPTVLPVATMGEPSAAQGTCKPLERAVALQCPFVGAQALFRDDTRGTQVAGTRSHLGILMRAERSNVAASASCASRFTIAILSITTLAPVTAVNSQAFPANAALFSDMRWRSIGPPRSGYISAPAGVPGDPTTYYVGTPEGGVWKTTNAGTTWEPIFDSVRVPSIGAVAVAPSEPNTVYVGTGNQSGWSFTPGNGIYKSTNAGRTWSNIGLHESQYIGAIVIDPRDANRVLVASQGGRVGGRGGRA